MDAVQPGKPNNSNPVSPAPGSEATSRRRPLVALVVALVVLVAGFGVLAYYQIQRAATLVGVPVAPASDIFDNMTGFLNNVVGDGLAVQSFGVTDPKIAPKPGETVTFTLVLENSGVANIEGASVTGDLSSLSDYIEAPKVIMLPTGATDATTGYNLVVDGIDVEGLQAVLGDDFDDIFGLLGQGLSEDEILEALLGGSLIDPADFNDPNFDPQQWLQDLLGSIDPNDPSSISALIPDSFQGLYDSYQQNPHQFDPKTATVAFTAKLKTSLPSDKFDVAINVNQPGQDGLYGVANITSDAPSSYNPTIDAHGNSVAVTWFSYELQPTAVPGVNDVTYGLRYKGGSFAADSAGADIPNLSTMAGDWTFDNTAVDVPFASDDLVWSNPVPQTTFMDADGNLYVMWQNADLTDGVSPYTLNVAVRDVASGSWKTLSGAIAGSADDLVVVSGDPTKGQFGAFSFYIDADNNRLYAAYAYDSQIVAGLPGVIADETILFISEFTYGSNGVTEDITKAAELDYVNDVAQTKWVLGATDEPEILVATSATDEDALHVQRMNGSAAWDIAEKVDLFASTNANPLFGTKSGGGRVQGQPLFDAVTDADGVVHVVMTPWPVAQVILYGQYDPRGDTMTSFDGSATLDRFDSATFTDTSVPQVMGANVTLDADGNPLVIFRGQNTALSMKYNLFALPISAGAWASDPTPLVMGISEVYGYGIHDAAFVGGGLQVLSASGFTYIDQCFGALLGDDAAALTACQTKHPDSLQAIPEGTDIFALDGRELTVTPVTATVQVEIGVEVAGSLSFDKQVRNETIGTKLSTTSSADPGDALTYILSIFADGDVSAIYDEDDFEQSLSELQKYVTIQSPSTLYKSTDHKLSDDDEVVSTFNLTNDAVEVFNLTLTSGQAYYVVITATVKEASAWPSGTGDVSVANTFESKTATVNFVRPQTPPPPPKPEPEDPTPVSPADVTGKAATGPAETLAVVIAILLTISVVYGVYVIRMENNKKAIGKSRSK